MRTTLTIDDDVLLAAKHMAAAQERTIGEVISELVRKALAPPSNVAAPVYRNGILQLPDRDGVIVTPELVRQLDEETQ